MSIDKYLEEKSKIKGANIPRNLVSHDHGWKYKKVRCQGCQKWVEYVPKEDWDGRLLCPHCKKWFKVPSLDGFIS